MLCATLPLLANWPTVRGRSKKKKRNSEAEHMLKNTGIDIYLLLFFCPEPSVSKLPFPFFSPPVLCNTAPTCSLLTESQVLSVCTVAGSCPLSPVMNRAAGKKKKFLPASSFALFCFIGPQ